jgi:hypothetical protein
MSETTPVSTPAPRRGAPGLTWAVILISIGVIFLLNNLGVIHIAWTQLINFWPVLLILIGLDIMLGRRSFLGSLITAGFAVLVIAGIMWLISVPNSLISNASNLTTGNITQALGDAKALDVTLQLGVTDTHLKALSGGKNAVEGTYRTDDRLRLDTTYDVRGDTGTLVIRQQSDQNNTRMTSPFVGELNLGLTDRVPVDLTVEMGVGSVTLDLTGIQLSSLTVKGGVGGLSIILPTAGTFDVNLDGGVGGIEIRVPDSLAASIRVDSGITAVDVRGFEGNGDDRWESSNFNSAANQASISVHAGIGAISITK